MSFLTFLSKLGHGAEKVASVAATVSSVVAPETALIGLISPAASAILNKVQSVTTGVESMVTTAQAGAAKKTAATTILAQELPQLQSVVSQFGTNVNVDSPELSTLIDAAVSQANFLNAFIKSLHTQTAPAPAAPAAPAAQAAAAGS